MGANGTEVSPCLFAGCLRDGRSYSLAVAVSRRNRRHRSSPNSAWPALGVPRPFAAKSIAPCKPDVAKRHTGCLVGGTSPFGARKALPVFIEQTILDLPLVYVNGGRRGYLVGIHPHDLSRLLEPRLVRCSVLA